MKKHLLFLLVLPVLVQAQTRPTKGSVNAYAVANKNLNHKPTTYATQQWNRLTNNWFAFADSSTVEYNDSLWPISLNTTYVSGIQERIQYEYDIAGRVTSRIELVKTSTTWDTVLVEKHGLDARGNLSTFELVSYVNGIRFNTIKSRYNNTYNASNQLTERIVEEWNEDSNSYINSAKWAITYNGDGTPTAIVVQEWSNGEFVNQLRINNYSWVRWSGTIDEVQNIDFGWGSLLAGYGVQFWNGTTFQPINRYTATFDNKQNMLTEIYESINVAEWEITEGSRFTMTYDADSNLLTRITEVWDIDSMDYINDNKVTYGKQVVVEVETGLSKLANSLQAAIYPNPAHNHLNIEIPTAHNASFTLLNIHGQVVSEAVLMNGQNHFPLNALKSGLYFYTIVDEKGNQAKGKLVVQ